MNNAGGGQVNQVNAGGGGVSNANFPMNYTLEACERIKEEYGYMQNQIQSLKLELDKLIQEKTEMQRHYVMVIIENLFCIWQQSFFSLTTKIKRFKFDNYFQLIDADFSWGLTFHQYTQNMYQPIKKKISKYLSKSNQKIKKILFVHVMFELRQSTKENKKK